MIGFCGCLIDILIVFYCCSLYDHVFRPNKLPGNADFHLFKAGIEPKWEDVECANGGKWTVISSRKETLDTMWRETVNFLSLVGFIKGGDGCLNVYQVFVFCSL